MNNMISVIIPIYNVESYIAQCLESVIQQTHKNLEIICIDDCSTDNSIEIVKKYASKDNRIRIIYHKKKGKFFGPGRARNTGLSNANGDYIFFLDPDDYIKKDILEKLLDKLIKTESDIVISRTQVFPQNKFNILLFLGCKKLLNYLDFKPIENYKVSIDNFHQVLKNVSCVVWGKLFSKNFIDKNHLSFGEMNYEDDSFYLKFMSCYPVITMINNTGVYYRIRNTSLTNSYIKNNKQIKIQLALQDAFSYIEQTKSPDIANKLIQIIKNCDRYCFCFAKEYKGFLWKIFITPKETKIKILGITILKKYKKNLKNKIKLFGILIYSTREKF